MSHPIARKLRWLAWSSIGVGVLLVAIAAFELYMIHVVLPAAGLSLEQLVPAFSVDAAMLDRVLLAIGIHGLAFVVLAAGLLARADWARMGFILLSAVTAAANGLGLVGLTGAGPILADMGVAGSTTLWLLALGLALTVAGFVWCMFWLMTPAVRALFDRTLGTSAEA